MDNNNNATNVVNGITSFLSGDNQPTIKHRIDPESIMLLAAMAVVVIAIGLVLKAITAKLMK